MIQAGKDHLLFDGDCGICTWCSELAKRMNSEFVVQPYLMFDEAELQQFGINYESCTKELKVITRQGQVYGGAFGVNYFLWQRPVWKPLIVLTYALPILLLCEVIGYKLVAINRHRISAWFGLKACALKR
ncbi:MAG: DCC1-like thiol-disulfide oxidoreductase family protein [Acidobacteriota bacterium]|nr:DCC1-like thiol-disulfide oxidoreductase family protein [Acidobacteriota bacterium]